LIKIYNFIYYLKTKILTRTPQNYSFRSVLYLKLLSKIYCFAKNLNSIRKITRENFSEGTLISVNFEDDKSIFVQDFIRCNRFISGYERALTRIWLQYGLGNSNPKYKFDTVIDIGANIGEFSLAAVQHDCKKVYAFEPDPTCFVCLVKNSKNHQQIIKTMNFALSSLNKKTPFYLSGRSADSSLIEPIDFLNKIYLETQRLDEISEIQALKKIDLLKMDAEGAEPEVLEGCMGVLGKIRSFTIDVGPERKGKSTYNLVAQFFLRNKIDYKYIIHSSGRQLIHAGELAKND
jgi:FkbM family methyltransferase